MDHIAEERTIGEIHLNQIARTELDGQQEAQAGLGDIGHPTPAYTAWIGQAQEEDIEAGWISCVEPLVNESFVGHCNFISAVGDRDFTRQEQLGATKSRFEE
jgi:hypothetical protein